MEIRVFDFGNTTMRVRGKERVGRGSIPVKRPRRSGPEQRGIPVNKRNYKKKCP